MNTDHFTQFECAIQRCQLGRVDIILDTQVKKSTFNRRSGTPGLRRWGRGKGGGGGQAWIKTQAHGGPTASRSEPKLELELGSEAPCLGEEHGPQLRLPTT